MTSDEKYADKISKLLRQAENVAGTPEADAFLAKAQELMTMYAIDEDMIRRAEGKDRPDAIVTKESARYTGIFQVALMQIGFAVVRANDCQAYFVQHEYQKPKNHMLMVTGYESDVDAAILLDTSLQVQCASAMNRWWRTLDGHELYSKMQSFKARREFICGFSAGVSSKLQAARRAGETAAKQNEAKRAAADLSVASTSVEVAIRDKRQTVKDWYDAQYGSSIRSVHRKYQSGGRAARDAGTAAGQQANVGQPGLGGSRRSIGGA